MEANVLRDLRFGILHLDVRKLIADRKFAPRRPNEPQGLLEEAHDPEEFLRNRFRSRDTLKWILLHVLQHYRHNTNTGFEIPFWFIFKEGNLYPIYITGLILGCKLRQSYFSQLLWGY